MRRHSTGIKLTSYAEVSKSTSVRVNTVIIDKRTGYLRIASIMLCRTVNCFEVKIVGSYLHAEGAAPSAIGR